VLRPDDRDGRDAVGREDAAEGLAEDDGVDAAAS
jgi:hypothetical protein